MREKNFGAAVFGENTYIPEPHKILTVKEISEISYLALAQRGRIITVKYAQNFLHNKGPHSRGGVFARALSQLRYR